MPDTGLPTGLTAPFPYFGGKKMVVDLVWQRLGAVKNYVEPYFGSGAMLLGRPGAPSTETVNDIDHYLCNFWRAVKADPDGVAHWADSPVCEADLQARHYWLITEGAAAIKRCEGDPDHYDAKVAGWWLNGACAWIGGGWCSGEGPWRWTGDAWVGREGDAGRGINRQLPCLGGGNVANGGGASFGQGINRKLPHTGNAGRGINRQLPHMGGDGNTGRGVNRKLPHLGGGGGSLGGGPDRGRGINRNTPGTMSRSEYIHDWMHRLADRLRDTRVACGDWSRVCGDSVTWRHGMTGVFLDPPYSVADCFDAYSNSSRDVAPAAREWAIEAGKRPDMRVAFCGYDTEHQFPPTWDAVRWKANGGFGSQGDGQGRANSGRETVWFSPACVSPAQPDMFA